MESILPDKESLSLSLSERLPEWFDSDDSLLGQLTRRIGTTADVSSASFSDEYRTAGTAFEYVIASEEAYVRRVTGEEKFTTKQVCALDGDDYHLGLAWIAWNAVLRWEIDQNLHINPNTLMVEQTRRGARLLGPFYGFMKRGVSQDEVDYYLEELFKSLGQLTDRIVLTIAGAVPDQDAFAPPTVDAALTRLRSMAARGMKGIWDPTTPPDIEIVSTEPLKEEDNGPLDTVPAPGSDPEQTLMSHQMGVIDVVYEWSADSRSYKDRSVRGATGHSIFGFTGRQRASIKQCLVLDREDRLDEASAEALRGYREACREIRHILYMIGGLGPKSAFENVDSLDLVISATDTAYEKKVKDNPVLKVLDGASGASVLTEELDAAYMTVEQLELLERAASGDPLKNSRNLFDEGWGKLSAQFQSDPVQALHSCEDSWSKSLDRHDPLCVLGPACPIHPHGKKVQP